MHDRHELAELAKRANSTELALAQLHEVGASPVRAILALVDGRGYSLADGKLALSQSPSWAAETRAADRLHEQLEQLPSDPRFHSDPNDTEP